MINFIAFLCSLCINFGAVNFPINYSIVNQNYSSLTDTLYNDIQNRGFSFDKKYMIVIGDVVQGNGGGYECFVPLEVLNGSNSSISVTSRVIYSDNNIEIGVNTPGWVRFKYGTSLNFLFGGLNEGSSNFSGHILNPEDSIPSHFTNGILYNDYYPLDFQGSDSFTWDSESPPVLGLEGHATGWSDLLIEDENGNIYTMLGHSNNGIDNSNSFDLVTASSVLSDKLLAAIGRLLSGINDSLSYGQGTLVGIGSLILTHVLDIKNWLFEPVDTSLLQYRWGHSAFGTLVDTINIDFNGHAYNPDDLVIRWNLSSIPYFEHCRGSFDLSAALDPSKYIWQPLLITLLYASLCWGFIRSIPNIIGGVSPISNNHIQAPKDTPKTSKGG